MRDGYQDYLTDQGTEWPNPYTQNRPMRLPRPSNAGDYTHRMAQTSSNGSFHKNGSEWKHNVQYQVTHRNVLPDFSKAKRSVTQPDYYNQTAQWLASGARNAGPQNDNVPMSRSAEGYPQRQAVDPFQKTPRKNGRSHRRPQKRSNSQKYSSYTDQYQLQEYPDGHIARPDIRDRTLGNTRVSHRPDPVLNPPRGGDTAKLKDRAPVTSKRILPELGSGFVREMARMFDETNVLEQRRHPRQAVGPDSLDFTSRDPLATRSQRRRTGRTPRPRSNADIWQPEEYFTQENS